MIIEDDLYFLTHIVKSFTLMPTLRYFYAHICCTGKRAIFFFLNNNFLLSFFRPIFLYLLRITHQMGNMYLMRVIDVAGKEEERAMFQQMQAMAQKQVSTKHSNLFHTR